MVFIVFIICSFWMLFLVKSIYMALYAFVVSGLLYRYAKFVCNRLKLVIFSPICTLKLHSSYRTHYINHLAADRTGLL